MKRTTPTRRVRRFTTDRNTGQTQPPIYLSWLLSESSCPHPGRFFLGQRDGGSTDLSPNRTEQI